MAARTLVLLRHAKAEPEGDLGDELRPLAAKGRRQAPGVGRLLRDEVGGVDVALVSTALRTRETFKLLAAELPAPDPTLVADLYQAGPRQVLAVLRELDDAARTVLVVGHEPTISGLAYLLHGTRDSLAQQVSLGVSTATSCLLDVPGRWADLDRGGAQLVRVLRPED